MNALQIEYCKAKALYDVLSTDDKLFFPVARALGRPEAELLSWARDIIKPLAEKNGYLADILMVLSPSKLAFHPKIRAKVIDACLRLKAK